MQGICRRDRFRALASLGLAGSGLEGDRLSQCQVRVSKGLYEGNYHPNYPSLGRLMPMMACGLLQALRGN